MVASVVADRQVEDSIFGAVRTVFYFGGVWRFCARLDRENKGFFVGANNHLAPF